MTDRAVLQLAKRYGFELVRQTKHLIFRHPQRSAGSDISHSERQALAQEHGA
jgi:phage protein D